MADEDADMAAQAHQAVAPIVAQHVAQNAAMSAEKAQALHNSAMQKATSYLNQTLERGTHAPVPGMDAG